MEAEKQETLAVETGQPETEAKEPQKHWYVIHTYSGYENKVKANLERKILSMGLEDKIFNVVVPMDDDVELQNGHRKVIKRKVFPGYVLVEMIVDDQSWYVVRNTPLASLWRDGSVKIQSLDEYAQCAADFLEVLSPETVVERLAGEASAEFLLAPEWTGVKHAGRNAIERELKRRGSWQGKFFDPDWIDQ